MTDTRATSTTNRGAHLAAQLDAMNDRVIAAVEVCTDDRWRRPTAAEGWPVGVVAHHIAEVQQAFARILGPLAAGESQPAAMSSAEVEENNARHARDQAAVSKAETLAALRTTGPELSRLLRGLDDDQVDDVAMVFDGNEMTVAQVVEFALVGHFGEHLDSIRATVAD
ncbi:MAG: DinB family protein [Chloroflexia bacterium]|nr:DinB family protein [Chloroflexia bacterium]